MEAELEATSVALLDQILLRQDQTIQEAFKSLRQILFDQRKRLRDLVQECVKIGKIEYKLTIDGKPLRTDLIEERLSRYEEIFGKDWRRLVLAVTALQKLHSELLAGNSVNRIGGEDNVLNQTKEPNNSSPISPSSLQTPSSAKSPQESPLELHSESSSKISRKSAVRPKKILNESSSTSSELVFESNLDSPSCEQEISPMSFQNASPSKDPTDKKYHCNFCSNVFLKSNSLQFHLEFDHHNLTSRSNIGEKSKKVKRKLLSKEKEDIEDNVGDHNYSRVKKVRASRVDSSKPNVHSSTDTDSRLRADVRNRRIRTKRGESRVLAAASQGEDETQRGDSLPTNKPKKHDMDPDIPLECSALNPVIVLRPLGREILDVYYRSLKDTR